MGWQTDCNSWNSWAWKLKCLPVIWNAPGIAIIEVFNLKNRKQVPSPQWGFETSERCSGSKHPEHSSLSEGQEGWSELYDAAFLYFLNQHCKEMFCEAIQTLQKD